MNPKPEQSFLEESLKRAEAALQQSELKAESLLQAIPDMIIHVNHDGVVLAIKLADEFPLTIPDEQIRGRNITDLFSPEIAHHYLDAVEDALSTQERQTFEHPLVVKGREKHFEIRIFPVNADQALLMVRDITDYKKVETMKVELVSFASHQLRTPVAEINGLANNLLQDLAGKLNPRQRKYVQFIEEISVRNLKLINDLLNVSKIEGGALAVSIEPVNLSEILNLALRNISVSKKDLVLKRKETERKILVLADLGKSVEALRNVILNALRFTMKGTITVSTHREGQFGMIKVTDTGPGISDVVLSKLFTKEIILSANPTATGEGTGLGLYIAKKFMDLQRGDLKVNSTEGKGSTFTFSFPLYTK